MNNKQILDIYDEWISILLAAKNGKLLQYADAYYDGELLPDDKLHWIDVKSFFSDEPLSFKFYSGRLYRIKPNEAKDQKLVGYEIEWSYFSRRLLSTKYEVIEIKASNKNLAVQQWRDKYEDWPSASIDKITPIYE